VLAEIVRETEESTKNLSDQGPFSPPLPLAAPPCPTLILLSLAFVPPDAWNWIESLEVPDRSSRNISSLDSTLENAELRAILGLHSDPEKEAIRIEAWKESKTRVDEVVNKAFELEVEVSIVFRLHLF
jgi:hypothetical protein